MGDFRRFKRTFDPNSKDSFRVSRSKIDLFTECPRCFYLDLRLGIKRPDFPSFTLNSAVDHLLKKEFDIYRADSTAHPLMKTYGIDAVPYTHPDMEKWRHNFTGVEHFHKKTGLTVFGAVDDIWKDNKTGQLYVVDYKSTSINGDVTLDGEWKVAYKRQVEIYQWLLRSNGFDVSDTAYFVYANGRKDVKAFDGKLEFSICVLPYHGDSRWVGKTLEEMIKTLRSGAIPKAPAVCKYCDYRLAAAKASMAEKANDSKKEPVKKSRISRDGEISKDAKTLF
ncbi:MAG: hypothetical protein A3G59_00950 [Candidatus Taylorbacteria bacterium RIFCSPLOWO2_12_FULL_47_20]|uniref:PD-(D/E)XK endonuclease-like domain-containing protein n=2 Tax=Candidatus Tayloriibacteriota TaxID=1817919 RepID=A0A1G2PBF4_9BACT|nr:MAG: hypothetical protein A3H68_00985 [Candidatus Taylorbacteria bacterium RIFCSPLOWO2_02_FULL_46_40]OHA45658.1 MAG: hypothetical protein A3G59_00950 [Candidatus Taylorbacteria bacterium RIFCSPLOWO2_12_FULL_47_20]